MDLKSSPLILSLRKLYDSFPEADPRDLEAIFIDRRFDLPSSIEEARRRLRLFEINDDPAELSSWYQSIELNIGVSNPHQDVKVVRLDTDVPANSSR